MNPRYPVYIISKGRWKSRQTSRALEKRGIPYSIVVEPQEYNNYAEVIDPAKIRVLPFANLGQGSIPARNWVWEDALSKGAKRHWILDDNIKHFYRRMGGHRQYTTSGTTFRVIEDFVDRYTNMALAGMQYRGFVPDTQDYRPVLFNTRIYSCILILNELPDFIPDQTLYRLILKQLKGVILQHLCDHYACTSNSTEAKSSISRCSLRN